MQSTLDETAAGFSWFLAEYGEDEGIARRVPLLRFPVRIGRLPNLSVSLPSPSVSKLHVELTEAEGGLAVRDLGSTNGTFINGRRISGTCDVRDGDLLQLANVLFRVGRQQRPVGDYTQTESLAEWAQTLAQFDRLMSDRAVIPHFQPIVALNRPAKIIGYEILGRSNLDGLETPHAMFAAGTRLGLETELSILLRCEGVRAGLALSGNPNLFVNTHPKEMADPRLLDSLRQIRKLDTDQPITIEIHEASVTDLEQMQSFRAFLRELDMRLAYDDFGAGQARLAELAEAPPDFLKFDITLISNIDRATPQRKAILASLVGMVRDLGIAPLAEGVERPEEAEACIAMGFDFAQGYFFGRPAPVEQAATRIE